MCTLCVKISAIYIQEVDENIPSVTRRATYNLFLETLTSIIRTTSMITSLYLLNFIVICTYTTYQDLRVLFLDLSVDFCRHFVRNVR